MAEKHTSENFVLFSMLMDAAWVIFALSFVTTIRPILSLFEFAAIIPPPYNIPTIIYLIFPIVWVIILSLFSVYQVRDTSQFSDEILRLALGSMVSAMCLAGILFLSYRDVSRLFFILFSLVMFIGQIGWRIVARYIFHFTNYIPPQNRNVLILGNPSSILDLEELIKNQPESGITSFTYQDQGDLANGQTEIEFAESVLDFAIKEQISDVIITSFEGGDSLLNTIVGNLHRSALRVWIIPDYFHLAIHQASVDNLSGLFLLELKTPTLSPKQRLLKRAFDLAVSLVLLLPALLIMGLISLAIRLETPGVVIFRQKRVGENGRLFGMYKFRTMVTDAEKLQYLVEQEDEHGNILHKKTNDPRITKTGKFLRRTSLDELPQLFNVIKGEMSLVGPRPELPQLVDRYQNWQRQRFTVPQGMTGWWQINGRSDRPMHLNTEDDIYYVQNFSLWLDFYILYKTVGVVISGKGAF